MNLIKRIYLVCVCCGCVYMHMNFCCRIELARDFVGGGYSFILVFRCLLDFLNFVKLGFCVTLALFLFYFLRVVLQCGCINAF